LEPAPSAVPLADATNDYGGPKTRALLSFTSPGQPTPNRGYSESAPPVNGRTSRFLPQPLAGRTPRRDGALLPRGVADAKPSTSPTSAVRRCSCTTRRE